MLYGTMARYMRRVREVFQPKNIMINCEKTPEELSKWAAENWNFNRNSYANDYTAFDQSQDGAMLQFEILRDGLKANGLSSVECSLLLLE